ncbi:hypothetical protein Tco_0777058, partial [Tanacetum coccineum]
DTYPILLSFTHCGNKSILRVLRIILVILPEHPSETIVFHNEDGNPARANIKQALGYLKDGDGDGNSQPHKGVKASANSDVMYLFTSAQDGDPLQDDVRLYLGDDLKKAQDHSQRHAMIKELSLLNLQVKDVKFAYEDNAVKIEETKKIRGKEAVIVKSFERIYRSNMVGCTMLCIRRSPCAWPQMSNVLKLLQGDVEVTKWARLSSQILFAIKSLVLVGMLYLGSYDGASDGSLNLCLSALDLLMDTNKKAKFNQQPNTLPSQPEFSDVTEFGKEGR